MDRLRLRIERHDLAGSLATLYTHVTAVGYSWMGASHRRRIALVIVVLLQVCAVSAALLWFSGGGGCYDIGCMMSPTDVRRWNYDNSKRRPPSLNTSRSQPAKLNEGVGYGASATPATGKQLPITTVLATTEKWTQEHQSGKHNYNSVISPTGKEGGWMENGTRHGDANGTGFNNQMHHSQFHPKYERQGGEGGDLDEEVSHGASATPGMGKQLPTDVATSEEAHQITDEHNPMLSPASKQEEGMALQENNTRHGGTNETGLKQKDEKQGEESSLPKKEIRPLLLHVTYIPRITHSIVTEKIPTTYQRESTEEIMRIMGRAPQRISVVDSDKIFVSIKTASKNTYRLFPSLLTWLQTLEGRQVSETLHVTYNENTVAP